MEEVSGLLWVSQSCKNQQNVIIRQRSDIFWHETMLSGRQRTIDNNVCELKVGIFLLHLWWKIQVTVNLIKIVHVFASSKPWRFLVLPLCYEIMIFNINAFCISHATTRLFIATRHAKLPNFLYPSLLSFSSLIIDSMFNISHFFLSEYWSYIGFDLISILTDLQGLKQKMQVEALQDKVLSGFAYMLSQNHRCKPNLLPQVLMCMPTLRTISTSYLELTAVPRHTMVVPPPPDSTAMAMRLFWSWAGKELDR